MAAHGTETRPPTTPFGEAAGVVSIARIERPPLHRGGSASTETMPAVSPFPSKLARDLSGMGADRSSTARVQRGPSQAARCASTEDHQAPSPPPLEFLF